ncbi:multiple epidermal growth factor-like domains protein 10 isoform X1 [Crassostrea angulata]|uniref:multiple epidermal growth factor-like domains protein 10 isoform X1 n=1 Tax=Magallana angulata TaxID=2784310 RepID=UPI0022B185A4|nr:multiple epidermal growth factor-like domains protein 10 isoform X1 [Crassostrea angulata]
MPMPHNISSLHQKECSPLTSSFTRKSKHVFADQDFFYMRSTDDETTDDSFRLSTAECFQLPEVLFALKNLKSECRMLSEREVNNCDFNEMDCTGVPFAKELCVNCKSKSCPENVTCYVLAGKCSRWYYSKKYVTGEKDIDGNLVCVPGFYGWMCSSKCSRHCVNGECHHINGTCLQGCNSGWKGDKCTEPDCPPNTYGLNCNMTCSPNCVGEYKSVDGTCWCKDGWSNNNKGVLCNKPCEPGMYGPRCGYPCGDCLEGTVCSPENGSCPKGCNKPALMRRCRFDEYGRNCENKCSSTCKDNYCRNEDGKCLRCPPGVQGHNCTTGNLAIEDTDIVQIRSVKKAGGCPHVTTEKYACIIQEMT